MPSCRTTSGFCAGIVSGSGSGVTASRLLLVVGAVVVASSAFCSFCCLLAAGFPFFPSVLAGLLGFTDAVSSSSFTSCAAGDFFFDSVAAAGVFFVAGFGVFVLGGVLVTGLPALFETAAAWRVERLLGA